MAEYTRFINKNQWKLLKPLLQSRNGIEKKGALLSTIDYFWKVFCGSCARELVGKTCRNGLRP